MRVIELTKGQVAIVDDDLFLDLAQYRWRCGKRGYAVRHAPMVNGKAGKGIYMHREIMGNPADLEVDHINGNKLDNRRCNLRTATHAQNLRNRCVRKDSTSGFKGVRIVPGAKFKAQIALNGKSKHIGVFNTVEEAHAAYCAAAKEAFGEFARFN